MNKTLSIFISLLSVIYFSPACKAKKSDEQAEAAEKKDYYPIGKYIQSQVIHLDSIPLAVIRYRTINNITDTAIIDKAAFKSIADDFIQSDISSPDLKTGYDESSFIDATLGTITLSYAATKAALPVRKADVLLNQENSVVRTIYIEKEVAKGDSITQKKMLWTGNKKCQVTTITRKEGSAEKVVLDKYVWDDTN